MPGPGVSTIGMRFKQSKKKSQCWVEERVLVLFKMDIFPNFLFPWTSLPPPPPRSLYNFKCSCRNYRTRWFFAISTKTTAFPLVICLNIFPHPHQKFWTFGIQNPHENLWIDSTVAQCPCPTKNIKACDRPTPQNLWQRGIVPVWVVGVGLEVYAGDQVECIKWEIFFICRYTIPC